MADLSRVRNIGISAHIDSGKTTLTERMLFYCGRIHKIRDVKGGDGGATMDHMDLERERGITITSAATRVSWKNDTLKIPEHVVNIIDTPGHVDFTVEVERSLRVLDGAILVLCSVGGVQSQSLTVDRQMKRYGVPRIAFINKMDRTGANPDKVMAAMRDKLKTNAVPLQIPIGSESNFVGVVDLVRMEAVYTKGDEGEIIERTEIPDELKEKAETARMEMLEALSQFDDELMGTLLDEGEVDEKDIRRIIRSATLAQQITPVLMGSAFKNKTVQEALDAVTMYLPCPTDVEVFANDNSKDAELDEDGAPPRVKLTNDDKDPMVAMAFKTVVETFGQLTYMRIYQGQIKKGDSYVNARTGNSVRFGRLVRMHSNDREEIDVGEAGDIMAVVGVDCASGDTFLGDGVEYSLENIYVADPVIRLSIEPAKRDDADKLGKALERFRREDPTFRVLSDEETNQTLIAGMGQLHLDVYVERIKREYGCECIIGEPRVSYRERPTKSVEFNHKRAKQSGGSGQYGHVVGVMEPLPEDAENAFEFENEVTGGRIPREYIPACEKGFEEMMTKGPLGEFEIVGLKIRLQDGTFHDVDSSDMAFKLCAMEAMRESILPKCGMALLEPIMKLEIETPDEFQGGVTGHISSKRGLVSSSEVTDGSCIILAEVPLAEMFDYANEIRSMTQGKGTFSMEFLCYRQAPKNVQEEVLARRRKEKEELKK
ncbi:elongation factor G [Fuerstiella marisgermanici]|uniref:Elongation factor G n=1 Tax=Fuerstiella marisgermanici TaxID=1891926 RepID=A0A1P8WKY5_9PLAN|nr:elongation factor G [Fuerstiella marisgermanici]APZ94701.1 Elongation factor G [Fuerstiella marisgermanici]